MKKFYLLSLFLLTSCEDGGYSLSHKLPSCSTSLSAAMAPSSGIDEGRYSGNQVFDVQRSPVFPIAGQSFEASSFSTPYRTSPSNEQYTFASGEYISFFIDDNTSGEDGDGCNVGVRLHLADGSSTIFHTGGSIWGLSPEGFLHISSNDYGTFVSNNSGHVNGDSKTYTPYTGVASCVELSNYIASKTPLGAGQEAPGELEEDESSCL